MLYSNRSSKTAATKNILISIQEVFIANLALKNAHTHSMKIITYALDILKNTLVQLIIFLSE
jgi:hypothetical protein